MQPRFFSNPITIACSLFLAGSFLSWYLAGSYFGASLDEGIYLNGGQRIANGQRLYVDFFAFIGPVLYWLQAWLSHLFGNQLALLRLSTALSVGAIVVGIYYLGRAVCGVGGGVLGSLIWLGVWLDLPNRMEVNHRWLSMALFAIAMAALLGSSRGSRIWNGIAGAAMGLAIFTTPSFVGAAAIVGLYLLVRERERFVAYLGGGVLSCLLVVGVLAGQGTLSSFVDGIRWAMANYGDANRFPFGRFPAEVPKRYFLQVYMGAISIPVSMLMLVGFSIWRRNWSLLFPGVLGISLLSTAYPKWDAYSLHFISGPYFVLIFSMLYTLVPERLRSLVQGVSLALFTYLVLGAWMLPDRLTAIPTRAGTLYGSEGNAIAMEKLEQVIPAKSSLFVYPYLTGLYALLETKNPTRHEYLQPGMMTARDEEIVLEDLVKLPPQFVFWQNFPNEDVRRLWPNSNPGKHRFTRLEAWIRANYRPDVEISSSSSIRGQVWVRLK